jgi:uncharacterized membrane protein YeaQ/YmgE (transglycosylase-associated protein family)
MKRYLIFAAVGPLLGGFWLLLTSTLQAGYWSRPPSLAEIGKLLTVFVTTLQYSYLFGLLPALMIGAVEDILFHVKRISPVLRILLVGLIAFAVAELLYGSRGQDSGAFQFIMYGLVGFIPGTVSAWLVHRYVEETPEQPSRESSKDAVTKDEASHDNGGHNVSAA